MSNCVGKLQEYAAKSKQAIPIYQTISALGESHCPQFTIEVRLGDLTAQGTATSKKLAKQKAARNMLAVIDSNTESRTKAVVEEADNVEIIANSEYKIESDCPEFHFTDNVVGQLQEYTLDRGFGHPLYQEGPSTGPAHLRHFIMYCSIGNLKMSGEGSTKKEAKRMAAKAVLDAIRT